MDRIPTPFPGVIDIPVDHFIVDLDHIVLHLYIGPDILCDLRRQADIKKELKRFTIFKLCWLCLLFVR